ncbi:LysR substrate-binding domain-containing protein [Serratia rubidaea]|uniref:LysR substrate-binding domain-containing protein n=1 Tax=Serratia rubidaea TaxID=61652 RepID=UPI00242D5C95|nr:LysR substrate-binding domain-containing protein [Serratia rubidaea]MCR0999320.1 LysR substrate-binding domain-containing protein [Serratia rubidaea]
MEKRTQALDLDALRSFVVGIESGSFALAAKRLCRSTSAVSAQLKKLEMQCGVALVVKNGRRLALTQHGEIVLGYARRMLALNDEAQRALQGELLQGEIRIGMQEDFGESLMPGMLGQLKRHHPGLRISARIDRNHALLSGLAEKTLDMALMWQPDTPLQDGRLLGRCQLEWVYHRELDIDALLAQGEPLPLVMFASPCLMRARATACLDRAGIPWRVMFVSHSLSGIWAAVQAGLGITVRTRIGMPDNLRIASGQLPSPGNLGIVLGQTPADGEAGTVRTLVARLMEEALADIR